MKLPAWIGLVIMLSMACWPSFAQEQRPTIRLDRIAAGTGPLVPTKPFGPGAHGTQPDDADDTLRQSMGCLIGGATATAIALLAGGPSVVNIIAGGGLPPANPVVLYTGLIGVVFASFCAIGQALTPLVLHYVESPRGPSSAPVPVYEIRPARFK